jgi:osmotically-inducible protein OsmY
MARRGTRLVTILAAAMLAAACQQIVDLFPPPTTTAADVTITQSVRERLEADRSGDLSGVEVTTTAGTVRLAGVVATSALKVRAEQLAWLSSGVSGVINGVQVVQRP